MKCPCGCEREIPNNAFWATVGCGKKGRKMGIRMPVTRSPFERTLRKVRKMKNGQAIKLKIETSV